MKKSFPALQGALLVGTGIWMGGDLGQAETVTAAQDTITVDANGDVGIGTSAPSDGDGLAERFIDVGDPSGDARVVIDFKNAAGRWGEVLFQQEDNNRWSVGAYQNRFYIWNYGRSSEDVVIDDTTGNLTLAGTCSDTDGAGGGVDGCDAVFEPDYELPSIEEHSAYMWANKHLPAIGPTPDGKRVQFSVQQRHFGMLNELEKAHIYIEQLNERLKEKDAQYIELVDRVGQKDQQIADLSQRMERLEAALPGAAGE